MNCPSLKNPILLGGSVDPQTGADSAAAQRGDALEEPIRQSYAYSELPRISIRLLRFKPSSSLNEVECELQVFALSQLPKYHSLSYCWGDPIRENSLLCSGKKIMITKTLRGALERLVTLDRGRVEWIWVDQICIDQTNVRERGTQVNIMKDIFQKSEGTIIWLGPDIAGMEMTAILLEDMWHLHNKDQNLDGSRKRRPYTLEEYEATNLPPSENRSWKTLGLLSARPWFVRTWVIQEAAFSKAHPRVLCGSYELDWEKLLGSASWIATLCYSFTPLSQDAKVLPALRSLHLFNDLKNVGLPWNLTTLLNKAIRFKATEPRDRVYSLVGLAGETENSSMIPTALQANYDKSRRDVFRDVTRYIIESSRDLSILGRIRYLPNWEKLPSWSVDFDGDVHWERISYFAWSRHFRGWHASRETPNNASIGLPVDLELSSSDDVLALRGLPIDVLDSPCEVMSQSNLDSFGSQVLSAWKMAHQQTRTRYPSTEAPARAFMVTLAANWSLTETELIEGQPLRHFWAYLWRAYDKLHKEAASEDRRTEIEQEFQNVLLPENPDDPGDPDMYRLHLSAAYHRRIFFTKNTSYIGLGPSITQQNDVLCVLFGGATPMILRPEGQHFRFVGECYVYDLMSGEAVKDWHAGKYAAQTFRLF